MYRTRPTQASVQCLRDAHVIWCENSRLAQGHKTDRCHVKQTRKLITLSRRRPGSLPEETQDSISVRMFFFLYVSNEKICCSVEIFLRSFKGRTQRTQRHAVGEWRGRWRGWAVAQMQLYAVDTLRNQSDEEVKQRESSALNPHLMPSHACGLGFLLHTINNW